MRRSHDIFDVVIAAMTARSAALGQTIPPAGDDLAAAIAEGWIIIPDKPISALPQRRLARPTRRESAFPRKRLVKFCTRRFRYLVDAAADAIAIRADILSAASESFRSLPLAAVSM